MEKPFKLGDWVLFHEDYGHYCRGKKYQIIKGISTELVIANPFIDSGEYYFVYSPYNSELRDVIKYCSATGSNLLIGFESEEAKKLLTLGYR